MWEKMETNLKKYYYVEWVVLSRLCEIIEISSQKKYWVVEEVSGVAEEREIEDVSI